MVISGLLSYDPEICVPDYGVRLYEAPCYGVESVVVINMQIWREAGLSWPHL